MEAAGWSFHSSLARLLLLFCSFFPLVEGRFSPLSTSGATTTTTRTTDTQTHGTTTASTDTQTPTITAEARGQQTDATVGVHRGTQTGRSTANTYSQTRIVALDNEAILPEWKRVLLALGKNVTQDVCRLTT